MIYRHLKVYPEGVFISHHSTQPFIVHPFQIAQKTKREQNFYSLFKIISYYENKISNVSTFSLYSCRYLMFLQLPGKYQQPNAIHLL